MKFLCLECDEVMEFAERQLPGDGTMAAVFSCGSCSREMAMLTNPMETQLVSGMGVKVGGRTVPEQPMEVTRTHLADGRADAFEGAEIVGSAGTAGADVAAEEPGPEEEVEDDGSPGAPTSAAGDAGQGSSGRVEWSSEAVDRLQRVPSFVRGMVKRIYTDYARERDIGEITPEVMDRARSDLGLEGM